MDLALLNNYYNKFNEDKRLLSRHGMVEFFVTTSIINQYLKPNASIIDIGAGSGRYANYYHKLAHEVVAVEPCNSNVSKIKKNYPDLKVLRKSLFDLDFFNKQHDVAIVFGPMYHLLNKEEHLKALEILKKIVKKDGLIFIAYLNNEYALVRHALMENNIKLALDNVLKDYIVDEDGLYCYTGIKYIEELEKQANLKVIDSFSQEGISDMIRKNINKLNEQEFEKYQQYCLKNARNFKLTSHIVRVIKNI